jgi:hypothetical protein
MMSLFMPMPGVYVHVPVHAHVHIPVHVPAHAHVHVPVHTHVLGQCVCRILVHHGNGQMYGHGHENGYETGLELSDYRTVDYRVEFFANYFNIHVRSSLTLVIFFMMACYVLERWAIFCSRKDIVDFL